MEKITCKYRFSNETMDWYRNADYKEHLYYEMFRQFSNELSKSQILNVTENKLEDLPESELELIGYIATENEVKKILDLIRELDHKCTQINDTELHNIVYELYKLIINDSSKNTRTNN